MMLDLVKLFHVLKPNPDGKVTRNAQIKPNPKTHKRIKRDLSY